MRICIQNDYSVFISEMFRANNDKTETPLFKDGDIMQKPEDFSIKKEPHEMEELDTNADPSVSHISVNKTENFTKGHYY